MRSLCFHVGSLVRWCQIPQHGLTPVFDSFIIFGGGRRRPVPAQPGRRRSITLRYGIGYRVPAEARAIHAKPGAAERMAGFNLAFTPAALRLSRSCATLRRAAASRLVSAVAIASTADVSPSPMMPWSSWAAASSVSRRGEQPPGVVVWGGTWEKISAQSLIY